MFLLFILITICTKTTTGTTCSRRALDEPIAVKDGDYIVAGFFNIGKVKTEQVTGTDGKKIYVDYCSYVDATEYGIQKTLAFKKVIQQEQERFTSINTTLGYELYDTCNSAAVTGRVSIKIANNNKVIGVSGVDYKDLLKKSAAITTSLNIPTFVYMSNDDEMMSDSLYPSLYSMIDTEQIEAEIVIRFLEKMDYTYMDIWYHKFSKDMAEYIHDNYVSKRGCGRIELVSSHKTDLGHIDKMYTKTGGTAAQVQLILSNSFTATRKILEYMLVKHGFQNKIYILGMSNGRTKWMEAYANILKENGSKNDTIIYPISSLLNANLSTLNTELANNWTDIQDTNDARYQSIQAENCLIETTVTETNSTKKEIKCGVTSWLGYMIGGVKVLLQALYENLITNHNPEEPVCAADFREKVYGTIVQENRSVPTTLDEGVSLNISFQNKTLSIGYDIGVYQSHTEEYSILGTSYPHHIDITNKSLFEMISNYSGTCSPQCRPGYYRLYSDRISHLPCCWTCTKCASNTITTDYNENKCTACTQDETSNENNTGCANAMRIYIEPSSPIFVGGVVAILVGLILVIIVGVIIFNHEERPVIKASDPGYLYMVLLGIASGFCTSFIPLLKPTTSTCTAEYVCFALFITIITANLAWKCAKIYGIFAAANNFKKPKFEGLLKRAGQTWLNIGSVLAVLCLAIVDYFTFGGPGWEFKEYQLHVHTNWYLMCNCSSVQKAAFVILPLLVPAVYFIVTLALAFKMRHFPHNFRETLNIFAATLIVLMCCIMFLSGYSLAHAYFKAFLRAIVIFVTCIAFLLCLFLPKMFILLRKNVDTEEEKAKINDAVRAFASKPAAPKSTASRPSTAAKATPTSTKATPTSNAGTKKKWHKSKQLTNDKLVTGNSPTAV